jgi:hypothetical protein
MGRAARHPDASLGILGQDEALRINAFNWKNGFPRIFPPLPARERAGVRVAMTCTVDERCVLCYLVYGRRSVAGLDRSARRW